MQKYTKAPYPECENCQFFRHDNASRSCEKHSFVMPLLEWQTVCRDWRFEGQKGSLNDLKSKRLYYYFYNNGAPIQAELAPFNILKTLIMSASIRFDDEFGWIVALRKNDNMRMLFPPNNTPIILNIDGRLCKFQMVNTERRVAIEPVRQGHSQIEHTQEVMLLRSVESKTLLWEWLAGIMDVEALQSESRIQSFVTFLEVLVSQNEYALHPDWLVYDKYKR